MSVRLCCCLVAALTLVLVATVSFCPSAFADNTSLKVKTDKLLYASGDKISITGVVQNFSSSYPVTILVFSPDNIISLIVQVSPSPSGAFSTEATAVGPLWVKYGFYTIKASTTNHPTFTTNFLLEQNSSSQGTVDFQNPGLVDSFGRPVTSVNTNQQIQITAEMTNRQNIDQPFAYFVDIVDSNGFIVSTSWISGTLTHYQSLNPAQSWTPTTNGGYVAQIFLLQSINNPIQLAPSLVLPFVVGNSTFSNSELPLSGFSSSTLSFSNFSNSTLSFSEFSNSTSSFSGFTNSILSFSNFSSSTLSFSDFSSSALSFSNVNDSTLFLLCNSASTFSFSGMNPSDSVIEDCNKAEVAITRGDSSSQSCSSLGNCFNPAVVEVPQFGIVEWINNDFTAHTITSGNPSDAQTGTFFDSGLIPAGHSFSTDFHNVGTFHYFCQLHPWMTGVVGVFSQVTFAANGGITGSVTEQGAPSSVTEQGATGHSDSTPGFAPSFTVGFSQDEYPLTINGTGIKFGNYQNNSVQTQLIHAGKPFILKILLYGDSGPSSVQHVTLFTDLYGNKKNIMDSDTLITWDRSSQLSVVDPHHLFGSVSANTTQTTDGKFELDFSILFTNPMQTSDIIIRSWDTKLYSADTYIPNAWQVVGSDMNHNSIIQTQTIQPVQIQSDFMTAIKEWGGYFPTSISDSQLLQDMGFHGSHIPSWFMKATKWIIDGDITQHDFVTAINYMYEKDIIK